MTKSKKRRRSKPAKVIKKTPRAKRTKTAEEAVLDPEKEAMKFVDIEPTDTYNGYLILKRGPVRLNESLVGPGEVRQLILCGN